jgi:hypothetical protein
MIADPYVGKRGFRRTSGVVNDASLDPWSAFQKEFCLNIYLPVGEWLLLEGTGR